MPSVSSIQLGGGSEFPEKLRHYRIEGRLGAGGMGAVYRAFDEVLQRPLALKHLLPQKTNPTAALRFRREALAAARLNHPAIVHIYDILETEEGDWIAMELVEGKTLERLLHEGSLGLAQAVRLGKEIAEGLAEAHSQRILHRDLKSSNVMVTLSGRAKILDFGIAKFLQPAGEIDVDLSQTGIVLGTCHAMSPEQIQGLPLDHRSDLFSFGSLLYEMVTGVSPFRAPTAPETLARIWRSEHTRASELRPDLPLDLSDLLDRLLRKNRAQRPGSAEEVARVLDDLDRRGLLPGGTAGQSPRGVPGTEQGAGWWPDVSLGSTAIDGIGGIAEGQGHRPETDPSASAAPSVSGLLRKTPSERRQVTVVCCELVGIDSGGGGFALRSCDPETLHERTERLRALAGAAASRYAGHLDSVVGHRVLIYFGYPQTFEDNALRAVRTALDLIVDFERMEVDSPFLLGLRVGIHTGPAVVTTGASTADAVTLGATLDLAVELTALGGLGEVVVSPSTSSLIHKDFVLEALPPVRLPGFENPLTPQRVRQLVSWPDEGGAVRLPLVGRDREMDLLLSRWELAQDGTGQVVLISGEAGIGKSRLALSLRERLPEDAARWLSGYASPFSQSSPLQPVVALLQRLIPLDPAGLPLDQLEAFLRSYALADVLPLFAALLDLPMEGRPPAAGLPPDRQREKTLDALVELLLAMTEREPVVLLIEDIHWADPTTRQWLDRLIEQVPTVPLLLVLTLRLQASDAFWGPRSHLTSITLGPLGEAEAGRLIDQVVREHSLPESVRRQIVERTDGVPLFVEELTKAALESHELGERRELPATLRDSLAARLGRLGSAREIAQLASVIGRVFSLDLLAAVSSRDDATLAQELRSLVQAELIYRKGAGKQARYLFKHALVQDAAYDSLLKRERQQIHLCIAETLEARFAEVAEAQPELLAHHFEQAGQAERAVHYWLKAGGLASSRSANQEAVHQLSNALRLLEALPEGPARDRRELETQNARAAAILTVRGYSDPCLEQAYARAEELAQRLDDRQEHFWAVAGRQNYSLVVGNLPRALELAEHLLVLAEADGSPTLLAVAWYSLGTYHHWQWEHEAAVTELEKAYDLAPPGGDSYDRIHTGSDLRVMILALGSLSLFHLGRPDRAQRWGDQATALAQELGSPFSLALARSFRAGLAHHLRDVATTLREAQAVYDLAVELGFDHWRWQVSYLLAWAGMQLPGEEHHASKIGDWEASRQLIDQQGGRSAAYYFSVYAEILAFQGRSDLALEALQQGLALALARGAPIWLEEVYRLQGEMLVEKAPAEAEPLFLKALEQARQDGSRILELRAALSLGRLWRSQGRGAEAGRLVSETYGFFKEGFEACDLRQARDFLESCEVRAVE
jgi:class 3 adenylate cyclase/tetratricopeptide (TPR) repeat protein